jgi:DtxR family Mn-dependent transcriptional regulator
MSDQPANLKCPLCGFEFEKANAVCHHGCPMGQFCKLIKCPGCQYEFPEPSQPLAWLARLLHPGKPPGRADTLDLTQLDAGETAEFVGVTGTNESRRHTLSVYGLVPGARVTLQQKRPAYVIRVGETELALEGDIAREILVRRTA